MVMDEARLCLGLEFTIRHEAGLSAVRHLQTDTNGSTSMLKGSSFQGYCWMSFLPGSQKKQVIEFRHSISVELQKMVIHIYFIFIFYRF